ncbi:cytochrome b [Frateuria aurantia]|uniref:Cytochrome b n=1 Tax=Frateuria aurantia (strain ATCC 33424 / DSM 6220 / KCTC 2777 / LMG 1558 / NBRC 3245 / NCIMB 13370) TaxID=767434 RepID=H8L539_FRAAD|nr:cytochrome b N-terminal domain-containing protein [Frateuria aurantia]AFC86618.1 cytochrome b subunit of the bc complex [Frateuria aurantia DSM 6220]
MSGPDRQPSWLESRLPSLGQAWRKHVSEYYAPRNFNIWYYFGSLALLALVNQLVTGLFLAMNYQPSAQGAFDSVQYIMRDVPWGWLIRYMHAVGASLLFVVIFLHMFRGLMYGSYQRPRELVWLLGMLLFAALMAEAFMGYVLPWGNMSFWGAKVIISLFGTVPVVGDRLVQWIMGDFLPADATLNRFFALHVIGLPLAILVLVGLHVLALHDVGSNNPDGIEIKDGPRGHSMDPARPADGIPFHPYYTSKDLVGAGVFLWIGAWIVFFAPTMGGWFLEPDNFLPANPMLTPEHIAPVWYFTPFYAILRMIPSLFGSALWGTLVMAASILLLFALPWIDAGTIRSIRYRGRGFRWALALFVLAFLGLGLVGAGLVAKWLAVLAPAVDAGFWELLLGRVLTLMYFGYFLFLGLYTRLGWERPCKPLPERVR